MSKRITILGTLDTKGKEVQFLKERIEEMGGKTIVVDIGILNEPLIISDIKRAEIVQASGLEKQEFKSLVEGNAREKLVEMIAAGAANILQKLYDDGEIDGAIAIGGGTGTRIAVRAMQVLPMGTPKLVVSSKWSERIIQQEENKDITLMNATAELLSLNPITRNILNNAAGAIVGMVSSSPYKTEIRALIGATCLGVITPSIMNLKRILESKNYEIIVCDRPMRILEQLPWSKLITGFLDLATNELVPALFWPNFSYRKRLSSIYSNDIPVIIAPGGLDLIVLGQRETIPRMFRERKMYTYMPYITLVRINMEEMAKLGKIVAHIANNARGPVAIAIPLKGFSSLDKEGQPFCDPMADEAFTIALKQNLKNHVSLVEINAHINDKMFAEKTVEILEQMIKN